MLTDTLIAIALLLGFVAVIWGMSLAITTDNEAGIYPGRLPEHETKDDEQC